MSMNATATLSLSDRIALTLGLLCQAVAAQISGRRMTEAMIRLVWQRVRRIDLRLQGMLRRFREGRLVVRPQGRPEGRTVVRSGGVEVRGTRGRR
jgi:hypothetical protein